MHEAQGACTHDDVHSTLSFHAPHMTFTRYSLFGVWSPSTSISSQFRSRQFVLCRMLSSADHCRSGPGLVLVLDDDRSLSASLESVTDRVEVRNVGNWQSSVSRMLRKPAGGDCLRFESDIHRVGSRAVRTSSAAFRLDAVVVRCWSWCYVIRVVSLKRLPFKIRPSCSAASCGLVDTSVAVTMKSNFEVASNAGDDRSDADSDALMAADWLSFDGSLHIHDEQWAASTPPLMLT